MTFIINDCKNSTNFKIKKDFMKSFFLLLICICASLSANSALEDEKIYVKSSEIFVTDNYISVLVDNELCEYSALNIDDKGIYVLLSDRIDWRCPYCNHINNNDAQYCRKCGKW